MAFRPRPFGLYGHPREPPLAKILWPKSSLQSICIELPSAVGGRRRVFTEVLLRVRPRVLFPRIERLRMVRLAMILATLPFSAGACLAEDNADHIWSGGPILTMSDAAMRAEAVAEKGGKIIAVG